VIIEHGVVVDGEVCARYAVAIERLVMRQLHRDSVLIPEDLAVLLADMKSAGRRWQEVNVPATSARTSADCDDDFRTESVESMTTRQVADRLDCGPRNVRDLVSRGRLRTSEAVSGRGLAIDPASVEAYEQDRQQR
jgi:DNA-directed RNA polymerase specialized sigma24 family protein